MAYMQTLVALLALTAPALSAAIEKRAACSSYTLINTRGTGELQGQSSAFVTMNSNVMSHVSGGRVYNVAYSAGWAQDSSAATTDIVNHITNTLATSPNECFILEGYSQGATATVNAMSRLTGNNFDAVKGVVLVGDPEHHSGLACNFDAMGGTSTRNVNGIQAYLAGIPATWVSKTRDICISGDGICDTSSGFGITMQHLQYPTDSNVQSQGATFITGVLNQG